MDVKEYIDLVSKQESDIEQLIESLSEKVLTDEPLRQIVIHQLITHDHILVYYHSFLTLGKAIPKSPSLFYPYWDKFELLLEHKNSYHRNYAMHLLAGLTKVDNQKKFDEIIDKYYERLNDDKFLTRRYCIINSQEIIKNKPDFSDQIINTIIASLRTSCYTEKQQNLLISDFINVVSETSPFITNRKEIFQFFTIIENQSKSAKLKKQLMKLYQSWSK
jgi:hypothetical protein